jgi:hypothetical protein
MTLNTWSTKGRFLLCGITAAVLWNCAAFKAVPPEGFGEYDGNLIYRAVSPDGVAYRVKAVDNEPYAELPFWKEAMTRRMTDAGYKVVDTASVTVGQKKGTALELAAPLGQFDYSYLIVIVPGEKKILVAEASGQVKHFQARKDAILAAIEKIEF